MMSPLSFATLTTPMGSIMPRGRSASSLPARSPAPQRLPRRPAQGGLSMYAEGGMAAIADQDGRQMQPQNMLQDFLMQRFADGGAPDINDYGGPYAAPASNDFSNLTGLDADRERAMRPAGITSVKSMRGMLGRAASDRIDDVIAGKRAPPGSTPTNTQMAYDAAAEGVYDAPWTAKDYMTTLGGYPADLASVLLMGGAGKLGAMGARRLATAMASRSPTISKYVGAAGNLMSGMAPAIKDSAGRLYNHQRMLGQVPGWAAWDAVTGGR